MSQKYPINVIQKMSIKADFILEVDGGEEIKSIESFSRYSMELYEKGLNRSSLLIVIGGGILGDLGGFIASVFMRGIDYVFVPTTLMSQADTTIQKVAISDGRIKNIFGSFYSPNVTFISTSFIQTLSKEMILEGLVEVIKHAFLDDSEHVKIIEKEINKGLKNFELYNWEEIIYQSLKTKAGYITQDPRDLTGPHKSVSWGHTFANAFEGLSRFHINHGLAVGYGMLLSSRINKELGNMGQDVYDKVYKMVNKIINEYNYDGLKEIQFENVLELLTKDKISTTGEVNLVVLDDIGKFHIEKNVNHELIKKAWSEIILNS